MKKIICISASNIVHSRNQSTSLLLCEKIADIVREKGIICEIIDLRASLLSPCIGCGKCYESKRCYHDNAFNEIYESIIQSEVYGIPAGIVSHGGGSDWALKSYKAMVNDTISNALETIQLKTVAFDTEWETGISLGVSKVTERSNIFPIQEYEWNTILPKLQKYIDVILSK